MKIISWNVNGIRAAQRNGFFDWFNKEKPDILCIQEIKAKEDVIPDEYRNIKGYELYVNSAEKPGYSGTAILTKVKPKKVVNKIGVQAFDSEGRFLFLEFDKFYLFNTYFVNAQPTLARLEFKQKFNEAYLKFVKKFKDKPIIMTGDYNVAHEEIDLARPKANKKSAGFTEEERCFVDKYIKNGYIDTYRNFHPDRVQYSWWSYRFGARKRNVGWRIDYFFINKEAIDLVKDAFILDDVMGSDHCPVGIKIKI